MSKPAEKKDLRFLVVDDQFNVRRMIQNFLRTFGYAKALEASDGAKALETLRVHRVDLVICDWNMPNMSGVELLRVLRADRHLKDLPFLMVTAETGGDVVAEAIEEKVDGYIVKPFQARTLTDKIEAILEARRTPDPVEKALEQGYHHLSLGRSEQAMLFFEQAQELAPSSPRVLLALGQALEVRQDDAAALEHYQQAVAGSKRFVKGHDRLAALYEKMGRAQKALEHLKRAVKISPRNAARQLSLGRLLIRQGRLDEGRAALERAMAIDPGNAELAQQAGEIMLAAGLNDPAAEAFHAAVALDPAMVHVFNRMGLAYRRQGLFQKAMEEYARALDLVRDDENLYYNLARAQEAAGLHREALESLKEALRLKPDFERARQLHQRIKA